MCTSEAAALLRQFQAPDLLTVSGSTVLPADRVLCEKYTQTKPGLLRSVLHCVKNRNRNIAYNVAVSNLLYRHASFEQQQQPSYKRREPSAGAAIPVTMDWQLPSVTEGWYDDDCEPMSNTPDSSPVKSSRKDAQTYTSSSRQPDRSPVKAAKRTKQKTLVNKSLSFV
jgi:hypothetical protein